MRDIEAVFLETERLRLCTLNEKQMSAVIEAETEPEMKAAYGEMLQGCLDHPEQWVWYTIWNMERKADSEIIGDLCFKGLKEDGSVEIGYGVKPAFEGYGYTTEAVAALIHWAAEQPGVTCVEAETEPDNYASQRVLEKNGFVPNGIQGEEGPRFVWRP